MTDSAILAEIPPNVPLDRVVQIDMYNPDGIEDGYHEAWKRLQAPETPAFVWTPYNGGHWIATRGAWIRDIYRDPANFSSEVIFLPKAAGEKYQMVPTRMDPPEHTQFRNVLDNGLNLKQIQRIESAVRNAAKSLVKELAPKGRCEFSADFAQIFPITVFMEMADLPMSDAVMLKYFASQMTRPDGTTPEEMAASLEKANRGFFEYVSPVIDARIARPGKDIISTMINDKVGDRPMTKEETLGLISLLLLAGLDTVVNFLSFVIIFLARNPDHRKKITENPQRIARSVEELFRRFPLVAEARMIAKDISVDGVEMKYGDMVLLPTALHGLDDSENPNPWDVDFDRKSIQHSTFGQGPHRCAGMHLARMEVIVMLEEWLALIPDFKLADDARPIYRSGIVAAIENVPLEWSTNS